MIPWIVATLSRSFALRAASNSSSILRVASRSDRDVSAIRRAMLRPSPMPSMCSRSRGFMKGRGALLGVIPSRGYAKHSPERRLTLGRERELTGFGSKPLQKEILSRNPIAVNQSWCASRSAENPNTRTQIVGCVATLRWRYRSGVRCHTWHGQRVALQAGIVNG